MQSELQSTDLTNKCVQNQQQAACKVCVYAIIFVFTLEICDLYVFFPRVDIKT